MITTDVVFLEIKDWFIYLIIILLGLAFCFGGRKIVKGLVSFTAGIFLGIFFFSTVNSISGSTALGFIAGLVGFVIGLAIGFFLFRLSISIILGWLIGNYVAYYIQSYYPELLTGISSEYINIILVLVFIVIIYAVFNVLLSIITIILGAALIYTGLKAFITKNEIILAITALIALAGLITQLGRKKRKTYRGTT